MHLFAICGEAGSGKDFLVKEVIRAHPETFHEIISYTTRPPRENEQNGVNYHFVSEKEFFNQELLEYASFRDWFYGTPVSALDPTKVNIGVFNLSGIRQLLTKQELDLHIFRLVTSKKERLLRQLLRENNPNVDEIIRRYATDEADFKDVNNIPLLEELPNENIEDLINNIELIGQKVLTL